MLRKARKELRKIIQARIDEQNNGVWYWIGTDPEPAKRRKILVSREDAHKIGDLPRGPSTETALVFDMECKEKLCLRRADCGLSCYCALEIVRIR